MTCTCPAEAEEVPVARLNLPESEGWRWYHLRGDARVKPGTIHYPACPLYRTREEMDAEQEALFRIELGLEPNL